MSTITRRAIVRGQLTGKTKHRDHFAMMGIKRGDCLGHPGSTAKRVIQGRILTPIGAALIFSHPTKRRTR
ncbi:MAG: hypothetical protein ACXVHK_30590, partial [Solirubrobacteraceae bacterium]